MQQTIKERQRSQYTSLNSWMSLQTVADRQWNYFCHLFNDTWAFSFYRIIQESRCSSCITRLTRLSAPNLAQFAQAETVRRFKINLTQTLHHNHNRVALAIKSGFLDVSLPLSGPMQSLAAEKEITSTSVLCLSCADIYYSDNCTSIQEHSRVHTFTQLLY